MTKRIFYKQVADLLAAARNYAKRQLDSTIAITYFEVGRMIVEREQQGQKRAQYGAKLIKGLSEYLTELYGKGFSVPTLKNIRQFYLVYSPSKKGYSPISLSDNEKSYSLISLFESTPKGQSLSAQFNLPWTHYQILMRVEKVAEWIKAFEDEQELRKLAKDGDGE